jgi:hypothetical protein
MAASNSNKTLAERTLFPSKADHNFSMFKTYCEKELKELASTYAPTWQRPFNSRALFIV